LVEKTTDDDNGNGHSRGRLCYNGKGDNGECSEDGGGREGSSFPAAPAYGNFRIP
jgi:hypothetical protein